MASEDPTKVSIKLLIDQESNKVIIAEAGSDIVDILRSLLKFPLGNIVRLIGKHQCLQRAGCLNNLYNSVENLSLTSFRTDACKSMLLNPRSIYEDEYSKKLKLYMDFSEPTGYFLCRTYLCSTKTGRWFSHYETSRCSCGKLMNNPTDKDELLHIKSNAYKDESEGESMFFITDDLRVMHGLPGDLMNILLNLGINNVCQIEEKVVDISSNEMSNLLSHSLFSKTTLTDVFLRKQSTMFVQQSMLVAPNVKERTEKDSKTRLKIMLRKSDRKILCGEANEDFVDLLFSFLTIPLESALQLLGDKGNFTVGSISNLLKDLDTIFSITKQNSYLNGILPPFYSCPIELSSICSQPTKLFQTPYGYLKELDPKSPILDNTNSRGYIKKKSLFVITDDLVVKSLSSVSSFSLLKETGTPLCDVEQQVISIGEVEALVLLRACICSSSALSALLNLYVKQPKQEPQ
ncbi:hypothetical protein Goarm_020919 [Gossypium armourianum]|uniref:DUF674 family protein n=1 Tax=Gossypium armourianum TaxID=34283 RepID=A0A7J9IQ15_9ROSI|nr:hypothetical protein [Gossypium armourianum]